MGGEEVTPYKFISQEQIIVWVTKSPETGVASCGDTPQEGLSNLKEALELYLENARELGMRDEFVELMK